MNYFLFEDEKHKVDMVFKETELTDFIFYWNEGHDISKIAERMKRKPIEVVLLVLDRAEIGKIEARARGLFG